MNVMMIGHSGAGKTTYMAAMYNALYNGIHGFSINSESKKLHKQLTLIANKIQEGYYPSATDIHKIYHFNLLYDGEEVLPFTWYDYRGGALLQQKKGSKEVRELDEKICNSNALIIFFDGEKIMRNDYQVQKEYRRTQLFIQRAISNLKEDTSFPISLVVTKGDTPGLDINKSPMIRHFNRMMKAMSENEKITGLFTTTVINERQVLNVHFPFLTSMFFGLKQERELLVKKIDEHKSQGNKYNDNANIIDDIWSFFADESSYRELASKEFNRARRKIAVYDELIECSNSIADLLDDAAKKGYVSFM